MAKEEIAEGLKLALSKGESLKQAISSFQGAGYSNEEIEEAVQSLQLDSDKKIELIGRPMMEAQQVQAQTAQQPMVKPLPTSPTFPTTQQAYFPAQASPQRVSSYDYSPGEKIAILLLIFFLIILLGALGSLFFFKDELIEFFNKLLFS